MANVTPVQVFPGYTADATTITFLIADLPGLTAAEANPTTGNIIEFLRAIVDRTQQQITSMTPEARPTRASLTKGQPTLPVGLNIPPGTVRQPYTLFFDLAPTGYEPVNE